MVTPNGFENSFTPASDKEYKELHDKARERLVEVATAMSAEEVPQDALFVCIGGRYEYHNKGIDVFLDALDRLNRGGKLGRSIQAFIMIPSGHHGPDRELEAKLGGKGNPEYRSQTSHYLMNAEYDTITRRLGELGLTNSLGDKVKVYFIPSYLNGDDGIFNLPYYTLLCGMDLALFPSYYEPWGYTPLEALAFRVPTLTTTLAGFGKWVKDHYKKAHPGITVLARDDNNYDEVVAGVAARVEEMAAVAKFDRNKIRENAREVAQIALWDNQIVYYQEAYSLALEKVQDQIESYKTKKKTMQYFKADVTSPNWRSILVTRHLPEKLSRLEKLSKNLWWCWNESAKDLFRSIDPEVWHKSGHNPLVVLDTVSIKRFQQLSEDKDFLARMKDAQKTYDYLVDCGIIVRNRTRIQLCNNCLRITIGTKTENGEEVNISFFESVPFDPYPTFARGSGSEGFSCFMGRMVWSSNMTAGCPRAMRGFLRSRASARIRLVRSRRLASVYVCPAWMAMCCGL